MPHLLLLLGGELYENKLFQDEHLMTSQCPNLHASIRIIANINKNATEFLALAT